MGWLGYSENQTLATSMPALERAYQGLQKKLKYIYGTPEEPPKPPAAPDDVAGSIKTVLRSMKREPRGMGR